MNETKSGEHTGRSKRTCLVVAQHLSHYRAGVYARLQSDPGWVFVFAGGEKSREPGIEGIPDGKLEHVIELKELWLGKQLLWQRGLLRLCRQKQFDAVILSGNAAHVSTWVCAAYLRLRKVPLLFWTIGWHRPDENLAKRELRKLFYSLADRLLLYGIDGLEIGRAMGFPADRMRVVGNSYSSSFSSADEHAVRFSDEELRNRLPNDDAAAVGAVARLSENKRFDLLVEAVCRVRDRGRSVAIVLTGDGPARGSIEKRARETGVPVYFTGPLHSAREIKSIYQRLAVTVIPERAGLTVLQSLEHGRPVITVNDRHRQVPEYRAVVPGRTGALYRAGDIDELSDHIVDWLDRVDADSDGIAAQCEAEVTANWSVEAHAGKIVLSLGELCRINLV